jgi:hypothetical protein
LQIDRIIVTVSLIIPASASSVPYGRARRPLDLPKFADLPIATKVTLERASEVIERLAKMCSARSSFLDTTLPQPSAPIPHIHHALTPLFSLVQAAIPLNAARAERSVLAERAPQILAAVRSGVAGEFKAAVATVAFDLTGSAELRRRDRCASPDRHGRYVIYPDPAGISEQLAAIAEWLASADRQVSAYRAMGTLVAITNCHPLDDGNGRLSRIIANIVTWSEKPAILYVPWREIALFSRGGFILRVREAEIRGDWQPLARFMLAALEWWTAVVAKQVPFD